jgi:hypothetical protein
MMEIDGTADVPMADGCEECGAPLPDGGTCIDHFHAMLLLEYEVAADLEATSGGRGQVAHYYAVSSYIPRRLGAFPTATRNLAHDGRHYRISDSGANSMRRP